MFSVFLITIFFFILDEADSVDKDNNKKDEKEKEKKALPDLDKYWKAVNDDPADFTGWTYLLQYVDQEVSVSYIFRLFQISLHPSLDLCGGYVSVNYTV